MSLRGEEGVNSSLSRREIQSPSYNSCATLSCGGAARWLHSCRQREVIAIDKTGAFLILAIITATIAFANLVLKIVEVSRKK